MFVFWWNDFPETTHHVIDTSFTISGLAIRKEVYLCPEAAFTELTSRSVGNIRRADPRE